MSPSDYDNDGRGRRNTNDNLTLRSARSARLEGWATARLVPTLRDASLRDAPQGEVVVVAVPATAVVSRFQEF
jgi:predicted dinucleotide-binding enzyme